jgi:adenine deaminase
LLLNAINSVIDNKGGICFCNHYINEILKLPIAGLMSNKGSRHVAKKYKKIEEMLKQSGSMLNSPLMNFSFLALLVIPEIKISDRGLFDFEEFSFTELFL